MSYVSKNGTKSAKGSLLITMMILLVSLFAVGCGDSQDDFVYNNGNNNNGNVATGDVTFQFERGALSQTQVVPPGTDRLHFDFFNAQGTELNFDADADYADTITVEDVPVSATSAQVTAIDDDGNAFVNYFFTFAVQQNSNVNAVPSTTPTIPTLATFTVSPATATLNIGGTVTLTSTATLSNGNAATGGTRSFTSANPAVATVNNATGAVTAVAAGSTTVTASYALNGVTRTATSTINVNGTVMPGIARITATPTAATLNIGQTQAVTVNYFASNATTSSVVTPTTGTSSNTTVATVAGGTITGVAAGTATATFTYVAPGTTANLTTTVAITVNAAGNVTPPVTTARLEASPKSLVIVQSPAAPPAPGAVQSGPITARFFAANATVGTTVTAIGTIGNVVPETQAALFTVTNNAATGTTPSSTTVSTTAAEGTTATLTLTYIAGGVTYTDTVNVRVGTPAESNAVISSRVVTVNTTASTALRLVNGVVYPIVVEETRANGVVGPGTFGIGATPGVYTVVSSTAALVVTSQTTNGITFAKATAGAVPVGQPVSGTLTVTRNNSTGGGSTPIATIPVTIADTTVAALDNLIITPSATTVAVGRKLSYTFKVAYADGTFQDYTPVARVISSAPAVLSVDFNPAFTTPGVGTSTSNFPGFLTAVSAGSSTLSLFGGGAGQFGLNIPNGEPALDPTITVTAAPSN